MTLPEPAFDGDAGAGGRSGDRSPAIAVDRDRAGDGQRSIFARIERRDDAIGLDCVVGRRERGARLHDGAGISIDAP